MPFIRSNIAMKTSSRRSKMYEIYEIINKLYVNSANL